MHQEILIPFSVTETWSYLMDPIVLSDWLNAPHVTTGPGEFHVFRIEVWNSPLMGGQPHASEWKFRSTFIWQKEAEGFRVELEQFKPDDPKGFLEIHLQPEISGCRLNAEWDSVRFTPLIDTLSDSERLKAFSGITHKVT
jgi:hypothetical protein